MLIINKPGEKTLVCFTRAEQDALLPAGKVASQMSDEEYWLEIDRVFAEQYPNCELGAYDPDYFDTEDI